MFHLFLLLISWCVAIYSRDFTSGRIAKRFSTQTRLCHIVPLPMENDASITGSHSLYKVQFISRTNCLLSVSHMPGAIIFSNSQMDRGAKTTVSI